MGSGSDSVHDGEKLMPDLHVPSSTPSKLSPHDSRGNESPSIMMIVEITLPTPVPASRMIHPPLHLFLTHFVGCCREFANI